MSELIGWQKIVIWLKKEESKARIARVRVRMRSQITLTKGQELFLLEKAHKAEATAKVLRKVLKMMAKANFTTFS